MENIFNRNRQLSDRISKILQEPQAIQEYVEMYIADPNGLMPAQWIAGEPLTPEQKQQFINVAYSQAHWLRNLN